MAFNTKGPATPHLRWREIGDDRRSGLISTRRTQVRARCGAARSPGPVSRFCACWGGPGAVWVRGEGEELGRPLVNPQVSWLTRTLSVPVRWRRAPSCCDHGRMTDRVGYSRDRQGSPGRSAAIPVVREKRSDAMKERASAPGGCWKLHASVSTRHWRPTMTEAYDGREVVGIDLHRRRSVLVRMTADGRKLETARITNSPAELRRQIARAGESPRVVLEATYGWYWAADTLAAAGAEVHLAHPLGVKGFAYRRVKNDERDAADLADLLRMGRLPEAWVAPHQVRELRELTRYRHKLVRIRTSVKDQVHAILAKLGIPVTCTDIFGVWGSAWPGELVLPQPYAGKVASLRKVCAVLADEIALLETAIAGLLEDHPGYQAVRALPGIGPVPVAVIVAEIGDVTRFPRPAELCSWAGLTPRHRESDVKVSRGHITKMECAGGMVPPRQREVCDDGGRR